MIFIDSDNCMGPGGRRNPDDGFAIAALLLSGAPVAAISSVAGNTTEDDAYRNNGQIADLCRFRGRYLRGAEVPKFLESIAAPFRIAALGPLTNIAGAVPHAERWCSELVLVGGDTASVGRWPPWWPYDFNLTCDVDAARRVFDSTIPLVIVPINLLNKLWCSPERLQQLRGTVGEYIRMNSQRWLRKKRGRFRLGDLVAAMYLLSAASFDPDRVKVTMHRNGWIDFKRGSREVLVVRDFDGDVLWRRFVEIVNESR